MHAQMQAVALVFLLVPTLVGTALGLWIADRNLKRRGKSWTRGRLLCVAGSLAFTVGYVVWMIYFGPFAAFIRTA